MIINFFGRKQKQNHLPKHNEPIKETEPISCIAQCIIDDLKCPDLWSWKYSEFGGSKIFTQKVKKYSLCVSYEYVSLVETLAHQFNKRETELILKGTLKIEEAENEREFKKNEAKDQKFLQEKFPQCFVKEESRLSQQRESFLLWVNTHYGPEVSKKCRELMEPDDICNGMEPLAALNKVLYDNDTTFCRSKVMGIKFVV